MSASPFVIERLREEHQRSHFDCGVEALNTYLKQFALQNERKQIRRTFVAVHRGLTGVVGFHTLAAGAVRVDVLPPPAARKLPRYPVPVGHLGRLAISREAQGQGLGGALLVDALRRIVRASEAMAVYAVEVVAKDDAAGRFYRRYGFAPLMDDPLHLYLPLDTAREALSG